MWFHLVSVPVVCLTILIVASKFLAEPKTKTQKLSYITTLLNTHDKTLKIKHEEMSLDSGVGSMYFKTTGQNVILRFQCSISEE